MADAHRGGCERRGEEEEEGKRNRSEASLAYCVFCRRGSGVGVWRRFAFEYEAVSILNQEGKHEPISRHSCRSRSSYDFSSDTFGCPCLTACRILTSYLLLCSRVAFSSCKGVIYSLSRWKFRQSTYIHTFSNVPIQM